MFKANRWSEAPNKRAESRRLRVATAFLLAGLVAGCSAVGSRAERYLSGFDSAERTVSSFQPASLWIPELSEPDAYKLQHRVVDQRISRGDAIAGFKGGLVSRASMEGKHAKRPLIAPLFKSGAVGSGATISLKTYRKAVHEMKIGFVAGRRIARPVRDVEALRPMISAIAPVVDLPDIAYADPNNYVAMDMIAANISSARYVAGQFRPPNAVDPDEVIATLTRDGKVVTIGTGRESLGNQWASLLVLVNLAIEQGYVIEPGQVIITGKIGAKDNLLPGRYRADYGSLGTVDFVVEP